MIQNPAAGSRRVGRLRERIRASLDARGAKHAYACTQEPGHAARLAGRAVERGCRRIIVAGGDGTVLEVVSAVLGSESELALLPIGTGNQLAANLGIPRRLTQAVDVALDGRVRRIDVGLVNERPFAVIAGAGYDAEVVSPARRLKRRIGYLAYVYAATRAALVPRVADIRVRVDGNEVAVRGVGVEVTNMPGLTAPGLRRPVRIVPGGDPEDGRFEVCVWAVENRRQILSALLAILTGRLQDSPHLRFLRGTTISVETDPPLPLQADGEQLGTTPFQVRVRPQALSVVVPVESDPRQRRRRDTRRHD